MGERPVNSPTETGMSGRPRRPRSFCMLTGPPWAVAKPLAQTVTALRSRVGWLARKARARLSS